jgi:hypothetical protein
MQANGTIKRSEAWPEWETKSPWNPFLSLKLNDYQKAVGIVCETLGD